MARRPRWWPRRSCRKPISASAPRRRRADTIAGGNSKGSAPMSFILDSAEPAAVGLRGEALERLCRIIDGHIRENRYPGAQIAVARHGKLAFFRSFGAARIEPERVPARDDTLWLLYSNTKVITAAAIWALVEDGAITFQDRIADHVPEF